MNNDKDKRTVISKFSGVNTGLSWSIGGLVVGITLSSIYGWTLLSAGFWIGFGLLIGAMSGGVSYMLYREIRSLVLNRRQAE